MWALDFLGLTLHADEKAIKRAYAKRLKQTRPDDDPAAFQALNEAYQAALLWYKNSATTNSDNQFTQQQLALAPSITSVPSESIDITADAIFKQFYQNCMSVVLENDAEALQQWLIANTPFTISPMSANHQYIVNSFITYWQQYQPAIPEDCFDVLITFFNFNQLITDITIISSLRTQLHEVYILKQAQHNHVILNNLTTQELNDTTTESNNAYYDIDLLCQQCIDLARENQPTKLNLWLNNKQSAWSYDVKQCIGKELIASLAENPVAIHNDSFSIIIEFFDINTISDNDDYYEIYELGCLLNSLWLFEPKHIEQLKTNNKNPTDRFSWQMPDAYHDWQLLEQLNKPFSWLQASWESIPYRRARNRGNNLKTILLESDGKVPHTIDPKQINFWLDHTKIGALYPAKLMPWTIFSGITLVIMLPLLLFILGGNIQSISNYTSNDRLSGIILILSAINIVAASLMSIVLLLWYCLWLNIPYYSIYNKYGRLFSIYWTPLLCFISSLLYITDHGSFIIFMMIAIFNVIYLSSRKLVNKYHIPPQFGYIAYFFAIIIGAINKSHGKTTSYYDEKENIFSTVNLNISTSFLYWIGLTIILIVWFSNYISQKENNR